MMSSEQRVRIFQDFRRIVRLKADKEYLPESILSKLMDISEQVKQQIHCRTVS